MSRYTRDYGQASSWYAKGWAPSKNTYSGRSKRPLVVIKAMSGTKMHREDRLRPGVQPDNWEDADVEIVDERDKNQGKAVPNEAVSSKTANTTGEKDATMRRMGLHRKKNTDANDKAYDLNQKSIQALDALAKEYVDFEATMAILCLASARWCTDATQAIFQSIGTSPR